MAEEADSRASRTIYLIDPDEAEQQRLERLLKQHFESVEVFHTAEDFVAHLDTVKDGCLVTSSASAPSGMTALELVKMLKSKRVDIAIVVIGDEPDVQLAVSLLRAGASDFVGRPFTDYKFRQAVNRALT